MQSHETQSMNHAQNVRHFIELIIRLIWGGVTTETSLTNIGHEDTKTYTLLTNKTITIICH